MLIAIVDILIFLITGGLLVTVTARIPNPLNVVCGVVCAIVLTIIAHALFAGSVFVILYAVWMFAIIIGLFALRWWLHQSSRKQHEHER
ncbi:hypothetical protein [Lacticaseibacillus jixiensis]|uniref:hypothetical protein n=1 Tax=Lacticaseibacillus jixiensis TaxID=3231926 RepID=UPI0036F2C5BB